MHAVQVTEFGPADVLALHELPDPVPGRGEVLIAVEAAGVNRADVLFRSGGYHRGPALPAVPGLEAAGRVTALGADVAGVAVGDRVLAWGATGEPGFYAELAAVPAERVLPVPDRVAPPRPPRCRSRGSPRGTACTGWAGSPPATRCSSMPGRAGWAAPRCRSPGRPGHG